MFFSNRGSSPSKSPAFFVDLVCVLGLLVAGLVVFGQVVSFDAINVDDPIYLDPPFKGGGLVASIKGAFTDLTSNLWHPLTRLSFSFEWWLFGEGRPGVHHATNLILHLSSGVLVRACFRELRYSRMVSFFVAALFLVHPVQSEAVAWISSRKGVLGTAFLLGSAFCFLRNMRRRTTILAAGVHLLLLASLLSTPVGVVAPGLFFFALFHGESRSRW